MNTPGYEQLAAVLQAAFDQAAKGKGAERHANDLPFHEQRMQSISSMLDSDAGMAYQVCKKIAEARGMAHDARERELLGAIVYTAGMIIYHRSKLPAQQDGKAVEKVIGAGDNEPVRVFAHGCFVCGKPGGHNGLPCPNTSPMASAVSVGQTPCCQDPVLQATSDSVMRDSAARKPIQLTMGEDSPMRWKAEIIDTGFDETRADIIGQNGNDGEHYAEVKATTFADLADQVQKSPSKAAKAPVALPNTDALVDPTGRPKWNHLPSWVKWIAQDPRGVWKGFEKKPEPVAGRWRTDKRWSELNSGEPLIGENWVQTLEERP